jgi:dipeptidase D
MQGGFKDNVIPREAEADILIGADKDTEEENSDIEGVLCQRYEAIKDKIAQLMKVYQKELATSEPELNFEVIDKGEAECRPMHHVSFEKVLFMLLNMPDGVQVMSSDIEGLVESSLNVGIFNVGEEKAEFTDSVRSSYGSYKYFMGSKLEYLISFLGGEYKVNSDYPAWEYMKDSRLREHLQRIYKSMYQKDMKVEAIHAGLECGILSEKLPGIDIVSIGPDMERVHTVDERLSISSTIRVYKFLEQIVKEKIR